MTVGPDAPQIPPSHQALFAPGSHGVLTTLRAGQPRAHLVTVGALLGTARFAVPGSGPARADLDLDRRVSLLVVDPHDTTRFVQVRGDAVETDGDMVEIRARRITLDAIHR